MFVNWNRLSLIYTLYYSVWKNKNIFVFVNCEVLCGSQLLSYVQIITKRLHCFSAFNFIHRRLIVHKKKIPQRNHEADRNKYVSRFYHLEDFWNNFAYPQILFIASSIVMMMRRKKMLRQMRRNAKRHWYFA